MNKYNVHFKGRSRISKDSFNKINVSTFQFNFLNFQIKTIYHFPEIVVKFSLANLECNYELNWNKLFKNFREYGGRPFL